MQGICYNISTLVGFLDLIRSYSPKWINIFHKSLQFYLNLPIELKPSLGPAVLRSVSFCKPGMTSITSKGNTGWTTLWNLWRWLIYGLLSLSWMFVVILTHDYINFVCFIVFLFLYWVGRLCLQFFFWAWHKNMQVICSPEMNLNYRIHLKAYAGPDSARMYFLHFIMISSMFFRSSSIPDIMWPSCSLLSTTPPVSPFRVHGVFSF